MNTQNIYPKKSQRRIQSRLNGQTDGQTLETRGDLENLRGIDESGSSSNLLHAHN